MAEYIVSSGIVSSGIILNSYDSMSIFSGGVAYDTTINSGGNYDGLSVSSGGIASGVTVNPGGSLYIGPGGTATDIVENGGFVTVNDWGGAVNGKASFKPNVISGQVLGNGDGDTLSATVHSGTTANSTTIYTGGSLLVLSRGIADFTTVSSGGSFVLSGGTASNTIVNYGGFFEGNSSVDDSGVSTVAMAVSTTVHTGGYCGLWGIASCNTVNSGGTLCTYGSAVNTTVNSGGTFCVKGVAEKNVINAGGFVTFHWSGGGLSSTTVKPGAWLILSSGNRAVSTTVLPGAVISLTGGVLSDTELHSGGSIQLSSGGILYNTTILSGGSFHVAHGVVSNTKVSSGARLEVAVYGGTACQTSVFSGGEFFVSEGGSAFHTIVGSGGNMIVSGGMAYVTSTTLSHGNLTVSDGRISGVTVKSGGSLVFSSGFLNDLSVSEGGSVAIYTGIANKTRMNGNMVISGGLASETTIGSGNLEVCGEGQAIDLMVSSGGSLRVFSGGRATSVTLQSGAGILCDHGEVLSVTILSGARLEMNSGTSIEAAVPVGGYVSAMTNGAAQWVQISGGSLLLYSGAAVAYATVSYGPKSGLVHVFSGGTAISTTIAVGESMCVCSGGSARGIKAYDETYLDFAVASDTYIAGTIGSSAFEMKDGYLSGYTVKSGCLSVHSDAAADNTAVNVSGTLAILLAGTANVTTVNSGGTMHVSGGTANSTMVNSLGGVVVSSGGTANATRISNGRMDIRSGGKANNTTINGSLTYWDTFDSGTLHVSEGGEADDTEVSVGGILFVSSGGTANGAAVNSEASMFISSGGTAYGILENGGYVSVEDGADVSFLPNTLSGWYPGVSTTVHAGTVVDSAVVHHLYVYSGGIVNNTSAVNELEVYSGGTANHVSGGRVFVVSNGGVVNYASAGSIYIFSGGLANNTTVNRHCYISIVGGTANYTTVQDDGNFAVSSAGTANDTLLIGINNNAPTNNIEKGATANRTTMDGWTILEVHGTANSTTILYCADLIVDSGGVASHTVVSQTLCPCQPVGFHIGVGSAYDTILRSLGVLYVHGGGIAYNTIVDSYGIINVSSGIGRPLNDYYLIGAEGSAGQVYNTTINPYGQIRIKTGGIASDISIASHGSMHLASMGKITGQIDFAEGAIVSAYEGAILDFNISELTPGDTTARVSNLSVVKGAPIYTLTVSEAQADGTYSLATGAAGFDSTITVVNMSGDSLGTLIVGKTVSINGDDYTLSRNNDNLMLSINAEIMETTDPVAPVITEPGKDVLLAHIMPEAEYMYGCTPTAVGMLLGYYDLYGYGSAGFSNMIEGTVALKSRGTDGNAYDMDAFDTVLGRAIASEEYVYRFHSRNGVEATPAQELEYAFKSDNKTLNTDVWNCIADYLGTGQYWRGNENLSTMTVYGSLKSLCDYDQTVLEETDESLIFLYDYAQEIAIQDGSTSRTIRFIDQSMEHGLNLYVQSRGYKLDDAFSGTYQVDVNDGDFTFFHYMREIDEGRPVLIHIEGHSMVGYGYNESTQEIIFDDCYQSGQRMEWGGTYNYAGAARKLQSVTVIALDESSGKERPDVPIPENLASTVEQVSWNATGANTYIVEYSMDNFEHVIQMVTTASAIDMPDLPAGNYQWRVKADANSEWAVGEAIVSEADSSTPKVVQAVEDGNDDLFFATTCGTWENIYYAQHVGSINDWTGTNEIISASGKGRIQNLFFGSADPNVLCLTDVENGDAIFLDDVYTELPEELEANTARLLRIREIWAGAGDDIIDMTSQRFEYVGDGQTLCGGDGNDTIWANKGANWLFGDAGNDRIVGASGNDVIAGGIGDDRLHGGGGDDIFTFCENWGTDTVKQLETGTVTLWFASGSIDNWDEATLTYSDGTNSVKVSGVAAEQVTLKFGAGATPDDEDQFASLSNMGAFEAFTTRKIFEEATLA